MSTIEPPTADTDQSQQLAARLAAAWDEHLHVTEKLASIEASAAWAVARRLSQLRRRLAPEGSWRQRCLRLGFRGLRLWRREGLIALLRRVAGKLLRRTARSADPRDSALRESSLPLLSAGSIESVRSGAEFRVAFIGASAACEAQSLRYRVHNIIEALHLVGLEGTFFPLDKVQANLSTIVSHHVIVLVRLRHNRITETVIDLARQLELPIIYDIDDYLFDPWVMPYVESFHVLPRSQALKILEECGACLRACDYFTGSTSYLAEKASAWGKKSFVLPNGLNAAQLDRARLALKQPGAGSRGKIVRLGYLSGTRTHQADFRVAYPALMAVLEEQSAVRLRIVGDLDLGDFPGLAPYAAQIEILPLLDWKELPATMADLDVNLIPLELTPFNEGKSNLKYFEAGLVKVPSIASPTRINRENISHGDNGLLAQTDEEWYNGLSRLVADAGLRQLMGQNAFDHILHNYAPVATAARAVEVYRQIIHSHHQHRKGSVDTSVGLSRLSGKAQNTV